MVFQQQQQEQQQAIAKKHGRRMTGSTSLLAAMPL
jgi:hypothetical protein